MICNRTIEGANRNITMNQICDRIDTGYAVYDMNPDSGEFEVCYQWIDETRPLRQRRTSDRSEIENHELVELNRNSFVL